jgi:hypothetical protein
MLQCCNRGAAAGGDRSRSIDGGGIIRGLRRIGYRSRFRSVGDRATALNSHLLYCFGLALGPTILRFLLFRAAQEEQRWPEENDSNTRQRFVVASRSIQASSKLYRTSSDTAALGCQLLAVE